MFVYWFFWPPCVACRMLVPQPVIEPGLSAVKAQSSNHWTTGNSQEYLMLKVKILHNQTLRENHRYS